MKKRPLPRHCDFFLKVAKRAKLSHALGRALYACNGIQNGRWRFSTLVPTSSYGMLGPTERALFKRTTVAALKSIRPSTAQRWLAHWRSGGSIKSLSHGSAGRIR